MEQHEQRCSPKLGGVVDAHYLEDRLGVAYAR
jgi:hypothetical protein